MKPSPYPWLVFACCWFGGIFAGMDANIFFLVLPEAIAELGHTVAREQISQIGAYIAAAFLFGWMFGGISFGLLGDRFGRVKAMSLSIFLYTFFTGIASFAISPWQLVVCRFLTGLGVGGVMLSMSVLLSEVWPNKSRAVALGALITSYQIGVFLSGLLCQVVPDWHLAFMAGGVPVFLSGFILLKLKEPEIWKQTSRENPLKLLFEKGDTHSLFVGGVAFGSLLVGYWSSISWVPTWIQDLIGPEGIGNEKNIATMAHALCAIVGCVIAGPLVNSFGRLPTIIISFFGAFVFSAWMFLGNETFSPMIYWQDAALGLFIGIAQASMYIYLPELFATKVRGTSVGFCLNIGRLVTALSVLFMGVFVTFLGGYAQALMTFSGAYLVGLCVCLMGRETKALLLPE